MAGVMTATGLMGDCCVCCGRPVPEGVQVCKLCMEKAMKAAEYGWENVSESRESGSGPQHGCGRNCADCVNREDSLKPTSSPHPLSGYRRRRLYNLPLRSSPFQGARGCGRPYFINMFQCTFIIIMLRSTFICLLLPR